MSYETTDPRGAHDLLGGDAGWGFLDVRTEEEFQAGHVPGAWNVPVLFRDPMRGMVPNERFVEVVERAFPKESKLVLGCAAGMRSARACELLAAAGYANLVNMAGGFSGAMDPTGVVVQPGWEACGLPSSTEPMPERSYGALSE